MFEKIWNSLKTLFDATWLEHHFLYFALVGIVILIIIFVLIMIRVNKDIKEMDKRKRNSAVDYLRKTSVHARKKLKF